MKGVISRRNQAKQTSLELLPKQGDAKWKHPWWFVLFVFLSLGLGSRTYAQAQAPCTHICLATDIDNPLPIFAGANCMATLKATSFMQSIDCPGDKLITVRNQFSVQLGSGTDSVVIDVDNYIGQTLTVVVLDQATGSICTGYARLYDITPPLITCTDTTLSCTGDTSILAIGLPVIAENCDPSYTLTHRDVISLNDCSSPNSMLITRTWISRDRYNNADTCIQLITLERAVLADVVFPSTDTLDCTSISTGPEVTGYPTWQGEPFLYAGSVCRYNVTYTDIVTEICGGGIGRVIDRTWRVTNGCTGEVRTSTQVIRVLDQTAPTITCPAPKTVRTSAGACTATVLLDAPVSIVDNCDPDAFYTVSTSYSQIGRGPHYQVPLGVHSLVYTAYDACGNSRTCTTTLNVVDDERPIAICDDELVISLNETGTALAAARNFNEGSRDNCVTNLYYKVRRLATGACNNINGDDSPTTTGNQEWFDDLVYFCCSDVGPTTIQVLLRVYTVNPGVGPVDPAREQPGGDLYGKYNECMSMVRVKDPINPQLYCPDNQTVECTTDLTELSQFGSPVVLAACGYTLDSLEVSNIDQCGRGTITRTFTATNAGGLTGTCTQLITVENTQMLRSTDIVWPQHITLSVCGASTEPQNLPSGFQQPDILRQPACGLSAIMYDDKFYDAAQPACFKVYRTWSVIDWCVYDPSVSATVGKFVYTQVIQVEDHTPPSFVCPADIVVPAATGCQSAQVLLPALVATDCSPTLRIVNNSPFAASPGANISGTYPLGTTLVKYQITDGCGNTASCQVRVIVEDQKAPGVVCIKGLSTTLAQMPGGIMAMVDAKTFDAGTLDNCSEKQDISFTIRRASGLATLPPTTTQLIFDCADIGEVPVELWATDGAGNSAFCLTTIRITDNGSLCPPDIGMGIVAGAIVTEGGNDVEDVKISIVSDKQIQTSTGVDGVFKLPNVPFGYDYTIIPKRTDDLMNGVSTIDLIRLTKHVLGVQPFTSPYQWIAADMDKSGTISTLDLVKLRKLILGKDTELSNGNTSWRFVDAAYKFPATVNPLEAKFPEVKSFKNFRLKGVEANFVAVKVGDINGSAIPNSLMKSESRATGGDMVIKVKDEDFQIGETVTVDFFSTELKNVNGYQFTLDYDERLLELTEMNFGDLLEMTEENFGFGGIASGRISTSWTKTSVVPEGDVALFSMTFKAKLSSNLITALGLADRPTAPEAYNDKGELMQILLQIQGADGKVKTEGGYELFQNYPNPFIDETMIGFTLPRAMDATLKIFDLSGRVVFDHRGKFEKGYNELPIESRFLGGTGIFIYQLATEEFTATRKMTLTGTR